VEREKEGRNKIWKGKAEGTVRHREKDRQYTYNVTYRRALAIIFAVETQ